MKKAKRWFFYCLAIFMLYVVAVGELFGVTQPRITPGLLSPDRFEMFVYENPPLASLDIPSGGLYSELIQAAFSKVSIQVTVTILPVKSLVKYNLLQDSALAIIGDGWQFTEAERNRLVVIPFYVVSGAYYFYGPAHVQGLSMNAKLTDLKGYTYGAHKGEDVSAYKEAGISIVFGNILSQYIRLKNRKIDFLSASKISKEWIVSRYHPEEERNYLLVKDSYWELPSPIIFNKDNVDADVISSKFREGLKKIIEDGGAADKAENLGG